MRTAYLLKSLILSVFCLSFFLSALAANNETINATNTNKWTHQVQGFVLFRYEDERFSFRSDRSRLRFIGNLGIVLSNEQWSFQSRLTTGLRDKQNVPAITLVHFSEQPQPDSDIYASISITHCSRVSNILPFMASSALDIPRLTESNRGNNRALSSKSFLMP